MDLLGAYETAREDLLAARVEAGHWEGRLAASALSTATAISALCMLRSECGDYTSEYNHLVDAGLRWLLSQQNADGGWGDTDQSYSNISTTMLVEAALNLAGVADRYESEIKRAQKYIASKGGVTGLRKRYGKDKTFAIPILTNCDLSVHYPHKEF